MKIAIVSSVFIKNIGYLEDVLVQILAKDGHEVCVFTSNLLPKGLSKTDFDHEKSENFTVKRLPTKYSFGSNVIVKNLKKEVLKFNPDKVILVGVSDFFSSVLLNKSFCEKFQVYAMLGNNYEMDNWSKSASFFKKIKTLIIQKKIKKALYRKALQNCHKIIFYTPATKEIIESIVGQKLIEKNKNKILETALGYDASQFYFDEQMRQNIRKELNLEDKNVIINISRIDQTKKIEILIDIINEIHKTNTQIVLILAGLDDKYHEKIKLKINNCFYPEGFRIFKFVDTKRKNELFNASDIGCYLKVGATIQQAMGTGLWVLLGNTQAVSHLVLENYNGKLFDNDIEKSIVDSFDKATENRKEIETYNKETLSYQKLIKNYFDLA
jgi:glycosyltransferase involved in cell wall biosynthesis